VYITGRNSDPTSCDDEIDDEIDDGTDDDLPLIKELWDQISYKRILTGGYQNPNNPLQDLEDPILDTSRSRLNPIQSKLDNSTGDSQGTRGMQRLPITVAS
jgi:hypothetical protein